MKIPTIAKVHNMKRIILSVLVLALASFHIEAALTKDFYKTSSLLNTGKWVKIGVDKTGVYEISYETLKAMGFNDPSKVGVFGRGGRVLPESFVSNSGIPILTDDLSAVNVLHEDGKLYFYGLGPEEINFTTSSDYDTGGYFSRVSNNIYTKRGYYFLTDLDASLMTIKTYDTSSATKVEKGVSYLYHERDSVQNTTQSGQLFWGERLSFPGAPRLSWPVDMPDAIQGKGVMHCEIYISDGRYGDNPTVSFGFEETTDYFSTSYKEDKALYYSAHEPKIAPIYVPGPAGKVFVEFKALDMSYEYSNLDFWVVSYQRNLPTMGNKINQQLLALPAIAKNTTGRLDLQNPTTLVVLDVTNPDSPERLQINQNGNIGTVGVKNTSKTPMIVVFDKEETQLQISGYQSEYTHIANQNLHGLKDQGADFIIITTNSLLPYAEEIAELHRTHDNLKVVVATVEQLYNEFSGGTPDPMAYRSFAKMLYFSDNKPKNILLFGPIYSDARGLQTEHDPYESIIAYQSPSVTKTRGAHNINDFYGMMSDKFRTDYYERNDVQIGVGILPVKFESEAKIVIDKIKNYLVFTDYAYYLNRFTAIGGIGDKHTHEIQVRDINNHIRLLDNVGTIFTPVSIDTYGKAEARKKFFNQLNEGCTMFSYFGHGAEQFLGQDKYFFSAGDVYSLRNKFLPFALFGGCQITNTDRGFRGLGETIVTSTPYGCIGAIASCRDTWSGQNYEFFKQFFTCLYTEGSTTTAKKRTNPVSIGEVYASVKNYSIYNNELAYQLLCDPALIIPIINRSVDVDNVNCKPGDSFEITGKILNNGNHDTAFNGQVVVRLNEPAKIISIGSIETGEDPGSLTYSYRDEQVSMMAGEVKNGNFKIKIHVPSSMSSFEGQNALLYISAYDPSSKVGAAQGFSIPIKQSELETEESGDKTAPSIDNLAFDNDDCALSLSVSDNLALNLSSNPLHKGLFLYVDGKERNEAHFIEPIFVGNSASYSKFIPLDGLAYGEHSARVKVKDAAGNYAEKEIVFIYSPRKAKYIISKDFDTSSASSTVIEIEGQQPAKSFLVVISPEGKEIWRGEFKGNSIEWDHSDSKGNRVSAGHYKAYLIETESNSIKGHSETIDVPVI